jgi:hypothetical protein
MNPWEIQHAYYYDDKDTWFQYTELSGSDTIRLVTLHPGQVEDDLHCTLTCVRLEDAREMGFEAVSYVWYDGDQHASGLKEMITGGYNGRRTKYRGTRRRGWPLWWQDGGDYLCCHQVSEADPTVLTSGAIWPQPSVVQMLSRFRNPTKSRLLWIDALCINQGDLQERARQILLMLKIYDYATRVLIWLGEELVTLDYDCENTDDEEDSGDNCRLDYTAEAFRFISWVNKTPADIRLREYLENGSSKFEYLLGGWYWFRRVWTFQEAIMAKEAIVMSGGHQTTWEYFEKALLFVFFDKPPSMWMQFPFTRFALQVVRLRAWRKSGGTSDIEIPQLEIRKIQHNPFRLENLMQLIRTNDATNPRDKAYAVFGLAHESPSNPLPTVDYTRSLEAVFTDIALHLFQRLPGGSLDFPSYAWFNDELANQLPSWVPDWSSDSPDVLTSFSDFAAAVQSPVVASLSSPSAGNGTPRILTVHGIPLIESKIVIGDKYCFGDVDATKMLRFIYRQSGELYRMTGETILQAWQKTSRAVKSDLEKPNRSDSTRTFWHVLKDKPALPKKSLGFPENTIDSQFRHNFRGIVSENFFYLNEQRFAFATEHGFMGLGPKSMMAGDIVCLFFGGKVLYVLRPAESGRFKLIGECFVYGLMHGEALEGAPKEMEEDFILE